MEPFTTGAVVVGSAKRPRCKWKPSEDEALHRYEVDTRGDVWSRDLKKVGLTPTCKKQQWFWENYKILGKTHPQCRKRWRTIRTKAMAASEKRGEACLASFLRGSNEQEYKGDLMSRTATDLGAPGATAAATALPGCSHGNAWNECKECVVEILGKWQQSSKSAPKESVDSNDLESPDPAAIADFSLMVQMKEIGKELFTEAPAPSASSSFSFSAIPSAPAPAPPASGGFSISAKSSAPAPPASGGFSFSAKSSASAPTPTPGFKGHDGFPPPPGSPMRMPMKQQPEYIGKLPPAQKRYTAKGEPYRGSWKEPSFRRRKRNPIVARSPTVDPDDDSDDGNGH